MNQSHGQLQGSIFRRTAWMVGGLLVFLLSGHALSQAGVIPKGTPHGIVPGRYIVVLRKRVRDPAAVAERMAKLHRFVLRQVYRRALKGFSAQISEAIADRISRDPDVAFVEPDRVVHALAQTLPTGVDRMDVDLNPAARIDGKDDRVDVDIAIIDTGIDLDHPDLNVVGSTNCARWRGGCRDGRGNDGHGHGTHVAGIAAALDNDFGVVGVAPGARLWAVRVLANNGSGYLSWMLKGIDWVTLHAGEIEVANMSLGWQGYSKAAHEAIQNSTGAGVVYVVAAGNDSADIFGADGIAGTGDDFCPACFPEVAAVSALTDTDGSPGGLGPPSSYGGSDRNGDGVDDGADDTFAWFSNFSAAGAIDLLCPGVDILSTYKGGEYATFSGTSMASPHAAGLAALHIAANGRAVDGQGVQAIRQALIAAGMNQDDSEGLSVRNDPDGEWEPLGWAGNGEAVKDIAVTAIDAPSPVARGDKVQVNATVKNTGTVDVEQSITVTLTSDNGTPDDSTDDVSTPPETIPGLAVGATASLAFSWDTADVAPGEYTLTVRHDLPDDNESNNARSTMVTVRETGVPTSVHVGDLDGESRSARWWFVWQADVTVSVHDDFEGPVEGALVDIEWSDGSRDSCTTDSSGRCGVTGYQWFWSGEIALRVTGVTHPDLVYDEAVNHDPDGDSDGTEIVVPRP